MSCTKVDEKNALKTAAHSLDYKEHYLKFHNQGCDVVHISLVTIFRARIKMLFWLAMNLMMN